MAVLPFNALPRVMSSLSVRIPRNAQKIMGVAARHFGREVVTNTPVDVGDARTGWVASVGNPSNVRRFASPGNKPLGSARKTLAAGRFADVAASAAAIAQHNSELIQFKQSRPGTSFFFTNNHPYIVPLEQGKLRGGQTLQNAPGWVERSIIVAAERALLEEVIPKDVGGGAVFTSFRIRS